MLPSQFAVTRKSWVTELNKGDNYWSELFGVEGDLSSNELANDSTLLSLNIIDEGNIAVLKIESFSQSQIEGDSARIRQYLESV